MTQTETIEETITRRFAAATERMIGSREGWSPLEEPDTTAANAFSDKLRSLFAMESFRAYVDVLAEHDRRGHWVVPEIYGSKDDRETYAIVLAFECVPPADMFLRINARLWAFQAALCEVWTRRSSDDARPDATPPERETFCRALADLLRTPAGRWFVDAYLYIEAFEIEMGC